MKNIIFKLGYNVSSLFQKRKYQMSFYQIWISLVILLVLISIPVLLYLYSGDFANIIINNSEFSSDCFFDLKIAIQFGGAIIYTMIFMSYYISKILFVNKDSTCCSYIIDSFSYVSNINGRVKKLLLKKEKRCEDEIFDDKILINLIIFRRIKIGGRIQVFTRKYRKNNVYVLEGDLKVVSLGFSLLVFFEFVFGLIFVLI